MSRLKRLKQRSRRPGWFNGQEGIDFVRCRICGDRRRVISGRHLSKHEIDRQEYIAAYRLSPDELIAKDFRVIRSSRPDFEPNGKRDWIAAIRKVYSTDGQIFAGYLQDNYAHLYNQGVWLFGNWDNALIAAGFEPHKMRLRSFEFRESLLKQIHEMRKNKRPFNAKYVIKHRPKLLSPQSRDVFLTVNLMLIGVAR